MSETAMAVSDDALKLLVAEHGVRGTARLLQMGETQMNTFRKRVSRAGWMQDKAIAAIRAKSVSVSEGRPAAPIVSTLSPHAAVQAELQALGQQTRVSIARTVSKAGKHFETMAPALVIADAGNLKSIAQTADLVHGWKDSAPQVKIRLDVLSGSADAQPIDIEATEIPSGSAWDAEDNADPLDEY